MANSKRATGTILSLASLATTLFQVGDLLNTPLQTLNGIWAVAFLLQETEIANTAKEVTSKVSKNLNKLIECIQDVLREKTDEVITRLHESMDKILAQVKGKVEELSKITTGLAESIEKEKVMNTPY